MVRKCTACGADLIEGITPSSPGWCSAECDLPFKITVPENFVMPDMCNGYARAKIDQSMTYFISENHADSGSLSGQWYVKTKPTPGYKPAQILGAKVVDTYPRYNAVDLCHEVDGVPITWTC